MFSHDALQSLFAKLVQTVMMHQHRNVHQKNHFTNRTSQFLMPWSQPCYSYKLKIFREYTQFGLSKSLNFSTEQENWRIHGANKGMLRKNQMPH